MTPRRPRLVFLGGFVPSKQRPSRVNFEKYQKVASLGPLRRSFLPRGSRFGAIRNREAASRPGKTRHRVGQAWASQYRFAGHRHATKLLERLRRCIARNSVPPRSGVFTAVRTHSQRPVPRCPGKKTKNVFRLDRFRGPGQSLGRASCSSRRRISRRALLAV